MNDVLIRSFDSGIKYIFIDFWDTIVHRTRHTELIKMEVCKKIKGEYNLDISVQDIYKLRLSMEKHLDTKRDEYCFCELAELIYSAINSSLQEKNITDCSADFISKVAEWEKVEEIKCVIPDEEMQSWIKRQNLPIYIVSDYYFGKEYIADILNCIGLENNINDVFVSCDYGFRKQSGKLYMHVMNQLQCLPSEVLMIGDNHYVDYKVPRSLGMKAFHKIYSTSELFPAKVEVEKELLRRCKTLCKQGAPLVSHVYTLFYFVEKIYTELKKRDVKNIFFLAREGELLKYLFEQYQDIVEEKERIKTHYLCVSRVSTFLASFRTLSEEDFGIVSKQFRSISYKQFFKIIGIDKEMKEGNLQVLLKDDIIVDWRSFIEALRQNNEFSKLYSLKRLEQRELFRDYMNQFGVDIYTEGLNIVDIGWKGTMQDNISNIYGNQIEIHGYYLGITEPGHVLPKSYKKGLIFEKIPIESSDYAMWSENIILYERILMASHGSTICYKKNNEQIEPVFDENAIDIENFTEFRCSREQIIKEFQWIANILKDSYMSVNELYEVFLECRKMSLFYKSKKTVEFERYLEKNVYENTGGKLFNVEKKTYIGYLKKILRKMRYNQISISRGLLIELCAYLCKVKGLMGCSAFFNRFYYRCVKNGGK